MIAWRTVCGSGPAAPDASARVSSSAKNGLPSAARVIRATASGDGCTEAVSATSSAISLVIERAELE